MNAKKHTYAKLPDVPLLAEVLGDAGFVTTGFYGNTLLHRRLGYNRGFKRWRFVGDRRLPSVVASEVAVWEEGERHFLYLHMFGAHQPLRPSAESKEKWGVDSKYIVPGKGFKLKKLDVKDKAGVEQYNLAYRAVVEDVDHRLGQVLAALGEHRADSLVIVTSDHGELLGEHDVLGHGSFVWEPLTDVPFAVDGGVSVPDHMTTASIADLVTRSVGVEHTWPVSVENPGPLVAQREGKIAFSVDGRFKGVWDSKNLEDGFAVFDLKKDVGETTPLGEDKEATLMSSRSAWESQIKETRLASKEEAMSEELILALQELGYME